ncbi:rubredoxin:oxygen/nitric oxide oxidoreductase [Citrifermentans bemidjiense Bem]|uniref:Rubredoxin:oxygen/nitric oxide oxidoreductase n=1 Tax=Citrifermentans bemidjiense (strain ATCC BAA-1014 / DSM 16622 / JCM 12645 / Bem) TaxID=404380 RepID=B5E980_CITBB|nr:FprA family A-type flavoprotein [Citrifermentans bemidjiense]ACH37217.1 rubredoxin:oxygen/nitric oxide oxidoreductase [Citrifermentans bemidjiense Bem]
MSGAVELGKGLHWIGVKDPSLTVFDDLFPTEYGTTYNSYLVQGDTHTAIIDTVKRKRFDEFLANIRSITDLSKIDYIVVNHSEPDHSGSLALLLELCPEATVVSSQAARTFLGNQIHTQFGSRIVKDNDTLDLGGRTLRFIAAPFLHWPDTMFTLLEEEGVLFPCDAFGSHYTGEGIFADEMPDFSGETRFYFDCIMRPFKERILQAVAKLDDVELKMLCPSHGPIYRSDARKPIELYRKWSMPKAAGRRIAIFYISPHGNTEQMAEAVAKGAGAAGVHVTLCHINHASVADIRDLMEECDGLIFGTPTINRDIPKPMWDVLAYLSTVSLKGNIGGIFGSFGWSGEACRMLEERLKSLNFKLPAPFVRAPFMPKAEALAECEALGRAVAEEVLKK